MKKNSKILVILLVVFIYGMPVFGQDDTKNKSKFPVLKGPYLGQKPPGLTPIIFAPGIISTAILGEGKCAFNLNAERFWGQTTIKKKES